MAISMYSVSVPMIKTLLGGLSAVLDKGAAFAAAKNVDPSVLANDRLAPDMFPLWRQIQIACDMARGGALRLAGRDVPSLPDVEANFDSMKARIAETLAFLGWDKNAVERVTPDPSLEACVANAQFVVEAAPEKLARSFLASSGLVGAMSLASSIWAFSLEKRAVGVVGEITQMLFRLGHFSLFGIELGEGETSEGSVFPGALIDNDLPFFFGFRELTLIGVSDGDVVVAHGGFVTGRILVNDFREGFDESRVLQVLGGVAAQKGGGTGANGGLLVLQGTLESSLAFGGLLVRPPPPAAGQGDHRQRNAGIHS